MWPWLIVVMVPAVLFVVLWRLPTGLWDGVSSHRVAELSFETGVRDFLVQDFEGAERAWTAVERTDPRAACALGGLYYAAAHSHEVGLEPDEALRLDIGSEDEAISRWREAAKKDLPAAQSNLYQILRPKSGNEALELLRAAADADYPPAVHALWNELEAAGRINDRAVHKLIDAANSGYPPAAYELAKYFRRSASAHSPDWQAQVAGWLLKAAERGVPGAQAAVGRLYETGELGFAEDSVLALKWYTLAAKQDHDFAAQRAHKLRVTISHDAVHVALDEAESWTPVESPRAMRTPFSQAGEWGLRPFDPETCAFRP